MIDFDPSFLGDPYPPIGPSSVRLRDLPVVGWDFREAERIRNARFSEDQIQGWTSAEEKAEWLSPSRPVSEE